MLGNLLGRTTSQVNKPLSDDENFKRKGLKAFNVHVFSLLFLIIDKMEFYFALSHRCYSYNKALLVFCLNIFY